MHLLITDSGVGGLSVCAYVEQYLRTYDIGEPVKLTYVNASPENDFGYNSMSSRNEKLENFDRFLEIIFYKFSPDSIYIACNTLSVLFPDTEFSRIGCIPVQGIVETGVNRLLRELRRSPQSSVAIFGTPTTIEEQTYSHLLQQKGINDSRIISQACPSLADTISEDLSGSRTKRKVERFVNEAIARSKEQPTDHLTYLACTHYGYRKNFFSSAFREHGIDTQILNPNEFVADELFGKTKRKVDPSEARIGVEINFITRYRIPETALETIAYFLDEVSPNTVQAFKNYTHAPDLF